MTTVFLHGFWGQPSDWSEVLKALPLHMDVWTPDFYEPGPLAPHHDLKHWCEHFFEELDERVGPQPVQAVGYSMGGRLLLNLLAQTPERFHRALILSGNPVVHDVKWNKDERSRWEMAWRQKFLDLPWEDVQKEWDELEIFSGSSALKRRESAMMREMLGQSLVNWSPSNHLFTVEKLKALESTVEWAFGALDQKYSSIAKDLANLPVRGQITIIENAGHRLPVDASQWIQKWIERG